MSVIAIIAALDREMHPLVDEWNSSELNSGGNTFRCYHTDRLIAVAGGIGCERAELAARAVMENYHPQMLVSAGLAGALIRSLKAGSVVTPNVVVDAATGTEYRCNLGGEVVGGGILVTSKEIAGAAGKAALVERFHGLVVDMEAAGVARVAQQCNVGFRCVKAISDEFDFVMPPLDRFVDGQGNFQTGKFVGWVALRPQHWANTIRLGRNSGRATRALSQWLKKNLCGNFPATAVVTLNGAECPRPIAPEDRAGGSGLRN
jgi:adenosylhomocysteine nucleosidase